MEPCTVSIYRERVRLVPIEIFTALWAAGLLAHQSKVSFSEWVLVDPVMVILAALALVRPGTRFVLPALAGVQLLSLWSHLPVPPNHWIFTGFISIGVLLSWAGTRFQGDPDVLGERFAPVARMLTVVLYGLTTFHKLNWGYLAPTRGSSTAIVPPRQLPLAYFTSWRHYHPFDPRRSSK